MNRWRIHKALLIQTALVILLSYAAPAYAAIYYVTPNGNATWPACTNINTPCSPGSAMTNVREGDTVYFRGGDYYPPNVSDPSWPTWYPRNSGTSTQPITIMAYPGEVPVIYQPTGSNPAAGIGVGQRNYIIWDGFRLIKTSQYGASSLYRCYMGSNNTIRNSEFIGIPGLDGLNQVGIITNDCTETYIYNNIFRDFTGVNDINAGAMWLFEDHHAYVYNNDFYNCSNGVQTKSSFSYIYAHHNFFTGVLRPFHWQQQNSSVTDFHVYNNVAILPASGTFLYAFDPAYVYRNNTMYNNTIYCTSSCQGVFLGNNNTLNFNAWNNIIYGAAGTATFVQVPSGAGTPEYLNYNDYYQVGSGNWRRDSSTYSTIEAWRATGFDANSVTTNPQFVNPGGRNAADYKRSSYPANGRGGSFASVMGAFITGNERVGYLPPPRSLR